MTQVADVFYSESTYAVDGYKVVEPLVRGTSPDLGPRVLAVLAGPKPADWWGVPDSWDFPAASLIAAWIGLRPGISREILRPMLLDFHTRWRVLLGLSQAIIVHGPSATEPYMPELQQISTDPAGLNEDELWYLTDIACRSGNAVWQPFVHEALLAAACPAKFIAKYVECREAHNERVR